MGRIYSSKLLYYDIVPSFASLLGDRFNDCSIKQLITRYTVISSDSLLSIYMILNILFTPIMNL